MTNREDVRAAGDAFRINDTIHAGATVHITGTNANNDELTFNIDLRAQTGPDGVDVQPKSATVTGPVRETDDGGTEPQELQIAYSSDVPRPVKERFRDYCDNHQMTLVAQL